MCVLAWLASQSSNLRKKPNFIAKFCQISTSSNYPTALQQWPQQSLYTCDFPTPSFFGPPKNFVSGEISAVNI